MKINSNKVLKYKNNKIYNNKKTTQNSENTNIDRFNKQEKNIAEYNILFYFAGDNNLQEFLDKNAKELGKIGSNKDVNLIMLLDRGPNPKPEAGGWKNAKFFRITKGNTLGQISKEGKILNNSEIINLADPKTLTNFLKEASKNWPAKHNILILNDHGGGFTGVISDDHPKGFMTIPQLAKALKESNINLDILAYDACLMAQVEVDYETKDLAKIALHSEESEGANGFKYLDMFSFNVIKELTKTINTYKKAGIEITPEAIAQKIVDVNRKNNKDIPTFSAIRLGNYIEKLAKIRDEIGKEMIKLNNEDKKLIKSMVLGTQRFDKYGAYEDFRDIGHFMQKLANSKELKNKKISKLAKEFLKIYDEAIIDEEHDKLHPNATGLSTYMPEKIKNLPLTQKYGNLDITKKYPNWQKGLKEVMNTSFVITPPKDK